MFGLQFRIKIEQVLVLALGPCWFDDGSWYCFIISRFGKSTNTGMLLRLACKG